MALPFTETFETNPGFDHLEWINSGAFPDNGIPGGLLGWGNECLYLYDDANRSCSINFEATNTLYVKFEFYVIDDHHDAKFCVVDPEHNISGIWGINFKAGLAMLQSYNWTSNLDSFSYAYNMKYMVEVYYNSTDGTWEWKLDGVSIGSGTDPDFVPDVIGQLWIWVGVGDGGTDRTAIYFDNILVDTHLPT